MSEAQLRKEFLDSFFATLGWDMDNKKGLAPQYRDVIHEDAIKIGQLFYGTDKIRPLCYRVWSTQNQRLESPK